MKMIPLVPHVLNKQESAEYYRLHRGPWKKGEELRWSEAAASLLTMVGWLIAVGISFAFMVAEDRIPEPHPDPALWVFVVVLFGGMPLVFYVLSLDTVAKRTRMIADYLDSIDYAQRVENRQSRSGGGSSYEPSYSRNYENHLWYGDHSELDWRDREQAQSWGMDADTYASNFLND